MIIDLGDVDLHVAMRVKGLRHGLAERLAVVAGEPEEVTPDA